MKNKAMERELFFNRFKTSDQIDAETMAWMNGMRIGAARCVKAAINDAHHPFYIGSHRAADSIHSVY